MIEIWRIKVKGWDGPRHEKLYKIWDAIEKFSTPFLPLVEFRVFESEVSHEEALRLMWADPAPEIQYTVFTEFDFLPELREDWLMLPSGGYGALGVDLMIREGALHRPSSKMGAWYMAFDRELCPRLDFSYNNPDPAKQVSSILLQGRSGLPNHYGIDYPFGTYLSWGRQLHNGDEGFAGGVSLPAMRTLHDKAVEAWVFRQPQDFQDILDGHK